MEAYNKHVLDALVRVLVFFADFAAYFPADSVQAGLIGQIDAAVKKLSEYSVSQMAGDRELKQSGAARMEARAALRGQLDVISRIARSIGLKGFWLPRDKGDSTLITVGYKFIPELEGLKSQFLDNHMELDFIDQLKNAVADLDQIVQEQVHSANARGTATLNIERVRNEALAALQRLDPIMHNVLRNDPAVLGTWSRCRRIERRAVKRQRTATEKTNLATETKPIAPTGPETTEAQA